MTSIHPRNHKKRHINPREVQKVDDDIKIYLKEDSSPTLS